MKLTSLKARCSGIFTETIATGLVIGVSAAGFVPVAAAATSSSTTKSLPALSGKATLSVGQGVVGDKVSYTFTGLNPNQPVKVMWDTESGSYQLDGVYTFDQPVYTQKQEALLTGTSDAKGSLSGRFTIPKGFGGEHTLFAEQNGVDMAQTNVQVLPSFQVSPKSGPVGTDGSATAVVRAAGGVGAHTMTIWRGWMGMPYVNFTQAPDAYLPVPTFSFDVTSNEPGTQSGDATGNYVEPVPASGANGGIVMPKLTFAKGVTVSLSKSAGTVGQPVTLTAKGLPANQSVKVVWNTMTGSRVSGNGFAPMEKTLAELKTDGSGKLTYPFKVPDDLCGVPHRIDLTVGGNIVGQAYLRILPSIVSVTPTQGPAGTKVTVELKGAGWTEYDNTYYITYDNAYVGYVCGFNSSGTVKFTLTTAGDPGYHLLDLYPGIYRGQKALPKIYNAPQLTYGADHPGDAIPAIRMGFDITASGADATSGGN